MKIFPILITLVLISSTSLRAQLVGEMDDESKLYAQSKQVNQFFRRFNGEEDEKGNRYYAKDKQYRSDKLRKKYLGILFDESNAGINAALKAEFVKFVLDKTGVIGPSIPWGQLVFRSQRNVHTKWKAVDLHVVHAIGKSQLGTKWVIQKVHADVFDPYFVRDTTRVGRFLHPLSHELDFMNLRKAFANSDSISQFTTKRYQPDHLSLLLYEMKKGNLKFNSVQGVKFHFFQLDGWYFEISQFNRPGYNTGWLISNLVKVNTAGEKEVLRRYLYNEK